MDKPKLTLENILQGLKDPDPNIRKKYLLVLARIDKPQVMKYITPLLQDDSEEIRILSQKLINHFTDKFQSSSSNEELQKSDSSVSTPAENYSSEKPTEPQKTISITNESTSIENNVPKIESTSSISTETSSSENTTLKTQKNLDKNSFFGKLTAYYKNSNNNKTLIILSILGFYFIVVHIYLIYSLGFINSTKNTNHSLISEEMLVKDIENDIDLFINDINKYLEELTFIQGKTEWFANNLSPIINKFTGSFSFRVGNLLI